jgi:hypothetical protein
MALAPRPPRPRLSPPGRAHSWRQPQGAADPHRCGTTVGTCTRSGRAAAAAIHHPLPPGLIVVGLRQSAADAAVDHKCLVGFAGIGETGGSRAGGFGQCLLTVLSGRNYCVLKALALLWSWLPGLRRSIPRGRPRTFSTCLLRIAASSTPPPIPGLARLGWRRSSSDARHLDCPVLKGGFRTHYDLLVNRCESKDLHLDIPDSWGQIEGIAAGFVGECSYLGIALSDGDRGSGDKLVRCSDRTALPGSSAQTLNADNPGNEVEIESTCGWKPIRRLSRRHS